MSAYLGFKPTDGDDYYFVSYNNEDADRVGAVLQLICGSFPIWYDNGIEYGDKWEETISVRLVNCRSVILFLTKGIFLKSDSYVQKEFRMGRMMEKDFLIVFLDRITQKDIPASKLAFWDDLTQIQSIEAFKKKDKKAVADEIIKALTGGGHTETPEAAVQIEPSDIPNPADIEPHVDFEIIPPHKVGLFGKGYTPEEKAGIRNEGLKQLKGCCSELSKEIKNNRVDGCNAYRLAKTAMIVIRDQLGAYNIWKYDEDQAMNLFKKNYDANLNDIRNYVQNHGRYLPADRQNLIKQIIRGLEDVILTLER